MNHLEELVDEFILKDEAVAWKPTEVFWFLIKYLRSHRRDKEVTSKLMRKFLKHFIALKTAHRRSCGELCDADWVKYALQIYNGLTPTKNETTKSDSRILLLG